MCDGLVSMTDFIILYMIEIKDAATQTPITLPIISSIIIAFLFTPLSLRKSHQCAVRICESVLR